MKQQVILIHGGRAFKTYQDYLDSLKHREVSKEKFVPQKIWYDSLQEKLGEDFEVFSPKMPDSNNARYEEWKIWFTRMMEFIDDQVIIIGHSLGGIFLVKYVSENTCPKKIKAAILLAAPFDESKLQECLGDFIPAASFENFSRQVKKIYLVFSKDDSIVPFVNAEEYKKVFPHSEMVVFKNRQHFDQESFPEMVELIKKIT